MERNTNRKETRSRGITLDEAVRLNNEGRYDLMPREEYAEHLDRESEARAEQLAETAWLRHAESLGWEEAYLESLVESGLRSAY